MLLRDGASCGAGKAHRLLRVPPTGCRAAAARRRARMAAQLGENPRRRTMRRPVGHANPRRLHRPTSFGGPGWPPKRSSQMSGLGRAKADRSPKPRSTLLACYGVAIITATFLKMRNAKCVPDMRCPAQSSSSSLPEPGKFPRKTWFSTPVGKQKHFGLPGPSRQNRAECVHRLPREWAGRGRWPRMAVGLPGRQNVTIFGGAASVSSPAGPSACRATSSSSRDARWPWCGTPARSRKFASSRKPCRVRIDSG